MAPAFDQFEGAFDVIVKLAPAASIIAAIVAARFTFRNNRRLNAEIIAKNHYREMLRVFQSNTDILYRGMNEASYTQLKTDVENYRRYRILFSITAFAMQELYFAVDHKKEPHWVHMIRVSTSFFRHYVTSLEDYPEFMRQQFDPRFMAFLVESATTHSSPLAQMNFAKYAI